MGVVYKAEDTKLQRTVAIKILPAAALSNDDDRARFYREARAAAALSHPNIATVYEIDEAVPSDAPHGTDPSPFIAMEFLEGQTLEGRIKEGPLKLDDTVRIASEMAKGLKAAHAKEIVHRDIKAANVMLDGDGRAKILDFGLAQTTASTKLTRMGSTLGTVAYMSPEQARGEEVDKRTDIWALGVTLYEMIAGTHPFGGDYEQAVVYSILNEDPEPLTAVRTGVPMEIERIVAKCTAKDAKSRYQGMADLLVDLANVETMSSRLSRSSVHQTVKPSVVRKWSIDWKLPVTALITALSVFAFTQWVDPRVPIDSDESFRILPLDIPGFRDVYDPEFSEDRTKIYFQSFEKGAGIFRYNLTTLSIELLVDHGPTWFNMMSPDESHTVYWESSSDGIPSTYLKRIPGGRPSVLSDTLAAMDWLSDGTVLLRSGDQRRMYAASITDGKLTGLRQLDLERAPGSIVVMWGLKNGKSIYGIDFPDGSPPLQYLYDWQTGESTQILDGRRYARFLADAHLIYHRSDGGALYSRRFDWEKMEPVGEESLIESLIAGRIDFLRYNLHEDGDILYARPPQVDRTIRQHTITGEFVREIPLVAPTVMQNVHLSPDGAYFVALVRDSASSTESHLVLYDLNTGEDRELATVDLRAIRVQFSSDGKHVLLGAFESELNVSIQRFSVDGVGSETVFEAGAWGKWVSRSGRFESYGRYDFATNSYHFEVIDTQTAASHEFQTVRDQGPWFEFAPNEQLAHHYDAVGQSTIINLETGDLTPVNIRDVWFDETESFLYGTDSNQNVVKTPYSLEGGFHLVGDPEIVARFDAVDGATGPPVVFSPRGESLYTLNEIASGTDTVIEWWQKFASRLE